MTHPHVDPPLIALIKETHGGKSEKYFVKIKLRRTRTSSTSDLYEFKISSFDNGDPEEFYCSRVTSILTLRRQGR